jgi:Ca2+-binding RTX toxin-like protein
MMATVTGTGGNNILVGTTRRDIVRGLAGSDTLSGLGGSDFLDGGVGNDVMRGGTGNDVYVVSSPKDLVVESAAQGIDLVRSSVSYTLRSHVENLTLAGAGAINGTGNALNNVIAGNSAANLLRGFGARDTLHGNGGADRLNGGSGSDRMFGGSGNDIYYVDSTGDRAIEGAARGTDRVVSTVTFTLGLNVENLTLSGNLPARGIGNHLDNVIISNGAGNVVHGLGGNDILFGGDGKDTLYGGTGNDTYIATCRCDTFLERAGEGIDLVRSSVDFDLSPTPHIENLTLTGASAVAGFGNHMDNVITGNAAANLLQGFGGDDVIGGGAGSDILVGGRGRDQLSGGPGHDTFRYEHVGDSPAADASAGDIIADFANGDKIDFGVIDADTSDAGDDAFTFINSAAFKGAPGELRYEAVMIAGVEYKLVEADVDGDGAADMRVLVKGNLALAGSDFVL